MKFYEKEKNFTLVELLVVITILAILAAVSVVGYLGFTQKAKQSADEQAVTQINTLLQAESVENKPEDIGEVIKLLLDNNLNIEDYKPLSSSKRFYWVESVNKVIYTDENNKILYPDDCVELEYK